jgi:4-hydroxy-tetrahydrodipicolinate reductase
MKIAVSGAAGRMGKRIVALGFEHPQMEVSGALETSSHPAQGKDVGEIAGIGHIGIAITDNVNDVLREADVLVDFSSTTASVEHVKAAATAGKAIVVGTTGFSEEQKRLICEIGAKTRCLVAPNMSLGVNLLFNLAAHVARSLGNEYDVEIVESHHKMKKDAPSGTAQRLAEVIAESLGRDLTTAGIYGRHGMVGERKHSEIGVMALRGGDIVGEHTVMFVTNGERIELIHRAHSRDAFAKGAIQAASWLVSRPNGLYDMQDVLGLKEGK